MRLTERKLMDLWALGNGQHAIDRSLSALGAWLGRGRRELAELPIGELQAKLFELYRLLAGERASALANCPSCREPVELRFAIDEVCPRSPPNVAAEQELEHEGVRVRFRQPDSRDLAAAALARNESEAREVLIAASVMHAARDGVEVAAVELDPELVRRIERQLSDMNPPAEILIGLTCSACGTAWSAPFDVGAMVWAQVERLARRSMAEVAALGRAFGWTEQVVLRLPPARRRYYQELS
jgi:hypothetical protein